MNDNWIWDRSGEPDAAAERLEGLLSPLAYRRPPRAAAPWKTFAAIAACLAVIVCGAWWWQMHRQTAWKLLVGANPARTIYAGQVLHVGTPAVLHSDDIGDIEVRAGSEVRVRHTRLGLLQGSIHATIWAPPRQFVVETPAARAVDLGCQYTLQVDANGDGLLQVETGWVAFEYRGRESFIPAGAECRTFKQKGPGLPYFETASQEFRKALAQYEENGSAPSLARLLQTARSSDALTLWHLLPRTNGPRRTAVYDRFAKLVPLPAGVVRDDVLRLRPQALDACWNALNLEDTGWWRAWERKW